MNVFMLMHFFLVAMMVMMSVSMNMWSFISSQNHGFLWHMIVLMLKRHFLLTQSGTICWLSHGLSSSGPRVILLLTCRVRPCCSTSRILCRCCCRHIARSATIALLVTSGCPHCLSSWNIILSSCAHTSSGYIRSKILRNILRNISTYCSSHEFIGKISSSCICYVCS